MGERVDELFVDFVDWLKYKVDRDEWDIDEFGDMEIGDIVLSTYAERLLKNDRAKFEKHLDKKLDRAVSKQISILESNFDWSGLARDCDSNYEEAIAEYEENVADMIEYGNTPRSTFLGTVFGLAPSGKYYTPWANSNVDLGEAMLDAIWYDALDEVAEKHGMFVFSGEGDPCDVFVGKVE